MRPVIDENDFRLIPPEVFPDPGMNEADIPLFVMRRHHDTY
jgi:hypothetical protein